MGLVDEYEVQKGYMKLTFKKLYLGILCTFIMVVVRVKKPTCVAPWALNWVDLKDFYKSHIKVKVSATYFALA